MRSLSLCPPSAPVYRRDAGSVDNGVTMHPADHAIWKNEPENVASGHAIATWVNSTTRTGPIAALLLFLFALIAPAFAQQAGKVSGVVVQFEDGTEQKLSAAQDPPASPPPPAPPSEWTRPILGINLESPRDFDRQFMFINVMKT